MKKLWIVWVLLFSLFPLWAQRNASNWGQQILLGTTFTTTDSANLRTYTLRDTVLADTLYSGVLEIDDWVDGIWSIAAWLDSLGGGADSVCVETRNVVKFRKKDPSSNQVTNSYKFGVWQNLFTTIKHDTLYQLGVAQSDSAWHQARSGRQYRVYDRSVTTDTSLIKLTDFLR